MSAEILPALDAVMTAIEEFMVPGQAYTQREVRAGLAPLFSEAERLHVAGLIGYALGIFTMEGVIERVRRDAGDYYRMKVTSPIQR